MYAATTPQQLIRDLGHKETLATMNALNVAAINTGWAIHPANIMTLIATTEGTAEGAVVAGVVVVLGAARAAALATMQQAGALAATPQAGALAAALEAALEASTTTARLGAWTAPGAAATALDVTIPPRVTRLLATPGAILPMVHPPLWMLPAPTSMSLHPLCGTLSITPGAD
mmetsp:Transcript_29704/g.49186  ORF Transcript_29704/g.49186 Transcript_29704/m.49186 type:complete len:173 (+) Transcript_29704:1863-2381(+)